jgi:hypothetical protein
MSPNKLWRSNSIFNLCSRPSIMHMNQEQEPENHVENLLDDEFPGKEFHYVQYIVGGLSALLSPSIMLKREEQEIPVGGGGRIGVMNISY